MRRPKSNQLKRNIIIIAAIISLVLYFAGVISGLYASKLIERKTSTQIQSFKSETKDDLDSLKSIVDVSVLDLKNIQLQQLFIDNFHGQDKCDFMELYMVNLYKQLGAYWKILPLRLEEYDKQTQASPEYIAIKREYIRLSLRFWVVSNMNYQECKNKNFIPILYFYTKDCEKCLEQGIEFDRFSQDMKSYNRTAIIFPIDANFEDDTVFLLKQYYNISFYPFIITNNLIKQGEIISSKNLSGIFKKDYP